MKGIRKDGVRLEPTTSFPALNSALSSAGVTRVTGGGSVCLRFACSVEHSSPAQIAAVVQLLSSALQEGRRHCIIVGRMARMLPIITALHEQGTSTCSVSQQWFSILLCGFLQTYH